MLCVKTKGKVMGHETPVMGNGGEGPGEDECGQRDGKGMGSQRGSGQGKRDGNRDGNSVADGVR